MFRNDFAVADLLYMGQDDKTFFYNCGGGLMYWEEADNAWEEYARWFSRCPYLLVKKGKMFVQNHQNINKHQPVVVLETPI